MGLLDKIKDNAKTISMRAIDATREYEEGYQPPATEAVESVAAEGEPVVDAEFIVDESAETPVAAEVVQVEETEKTEKEDKVAGKDDGKEARKSKVTEVPKADHEKAEKEKRQAKAKQAAKERLAKSYTPSYKQDKLSDEDEEEKESSDKSSGRRITTIGIVDIAPSKFQNQAKGAAYARERAALTALASQRKLNGTVPLYITTHMNFKTRVFIDRIEYRGSFGKNVLPIEKVAWVKLRAGGTGVIIETTEPKKVVMVIKPSERLAFANAVLKVQALQPKKGKPKDTKTIRIDQLEKFAEGIDEIEKLANLYDRGIITQGEFDAKKKQILGI